MAWLCFTHLPVLEAVQHQFDARRYAQLVKHLEKIISDDSGSTVLGFSIAFLALRVSSSKASAHSSLAFVLLAAALPLVDATLAVIRRLRRGKSILSGDRLHIYDLYLQRGYSPRGVALVAYAITAILAVLGWLCAQSGSFGSWMVVAIALATLGATGFWLGATERGNRNTREGSRARERGSESGKPALTD